MSDIHVLCSLGKLQMELIWTINAQQAFYVDCLYTDFLEIARVSQARSLIASC